MKKLLLLLLLLPTFLFAQYGPCGNQTSITYQGRQYDIVEIGSECWFAENLRANTFSNGTSIGGLYFANPNSGIPGYAPHCDSTTYGYIYNWYVAADSNNICPSGWRVPDITDFSNLVNVYPVNELVFGGISGFNMLASGLWYNQGGPCLAGVPSGTTGYLQAQASTSTQFRVDNGSSYAFPQNTGAAAVPIRCILDDVYGCTDSVGLNYNPFANTDDSSCVYCTNDTSYTNITACYSAVWNGTTYTQSGTYSSNVGSGNNYSMSFDGVDDWVEANTIDLSNSPFTIETWVKVPSISFNYQTNIIDNYETSNYTGDRWGIFVDGLIGPYPGKIVLSSFDDLKSINRIDDNIWHHIAVIRDSTGSIYLYVDGVLNDSGIESLSGNLNAGHTIKIGSGHNFFGQRFMDCNISEIQVSLTAKYSSNFTPKCTFDTELNSLIHYKFDNTSSSIVVDLSVNGNHGTIFGGANYIPNYPFCSLTNVNGCDSTAILNLIINQGDTSYTNITACDSLVWNGTTYDSSGTYFYNQNSDTLSISGYSFMGSSGNSNYYISLNQKVWSDADSICNYHGGHLAVISDNYENSFIYSSINEYVWIGLSDEQNEGSFIWANSEPLIYTNWLPTQPDNYTDVGSPNGQDYCFMNNLNGMWEDDNEIMSRNYILELPRYQSLTNANGCDSTATLNLTINPSTTSISNVTECDSYSWNGATYDSSGTYSSTVGSNNNYSMSFDGDDDYVNCGSNIDISNQSFTLGAWIRYDGVDSLTGDAIIMSTGIGAANQGLYFGFYDNLGSPDYLFMNFYVSGADITSNTPLNIQGDGIWHHIAVSYDYLTGERFLYFDGLVVGNDVTSTTFQSTNTDFALGISSWNNVDDYEGLIDDAFVYNKVLTQQEIQQYMNCPPTGNEADLAGYWNFEEGSGTTAIDLTGNGNDGTINGVIYDSLNVPSQSCTLTNVNGCDSTAILNLTINQAVTSYTNITACDTFSWNGTTYDSSGTYYYSEGENNYNMSFDGSQGQIIDCGASINQAINNEMTIIFTVTPDQGAFNNGKWLFGQNENGTDWFGCRYDHVTGGENFIFRRYAGTYDVALSFGMPEGETHTYAYTYSQNNNARIYKDGIEIANQACTLPALPNNQSSFYLGGDQLDNISGINTAFSGLLDDVHIWNTALSQQEIQNYMNCSPTGDESALVGYWNFEEGSGTTAYDQTSNGNNGTINGATYDTNVPVQSCQLTTSNGCDSTAILNLTINQSDTSYTNITACESYAWNGTTYDISGTYSYIGNSLDSNITGFSYFGYFNGSNYYISNSTDSWTNANSICNNYGNLVTITDSSELNYVNTILDYVQVGVWIGLYQDTLSLNYYEPNGGWNWVTGESLTFQNWAISDPNNFTTNPDGCETYVEMNSATRYWYDQWNTLSSFYYILEIPSLLINSSGCDSAAVLNLTINTSETSSVSITECDMYTWNGQTYTTSGLYTFVTTNSNGCDSTANLYLTINPSTTSTANVIVCDTYTWNGQVYTTSGVYTYSTTNSNGCDSTATLNLTINPSTTSTANVTACDTYTWNGQAYTTSGVYTYQVQILMVVIL